MKRQMICVNYMRPKKLSQKYFTRNLQTRWISLEVIADTICYFPNESSQSTRKRYFYCGGFQSAHSVLSIELVVDGLWEKFSRHSFQPHPTLLLHSSINVYFEFLIPIKLFPREQLSFFDLRFYLSPAPPLRSIDNNFIVCFILPYFYMHAVKGNKLLTFTIHNHVTINPVKLFYDTLHALHSPRPHLFFNANGFIYILQSITRF